MYGAVDRTGIEWVVGAFPFVFYSFVPGMLLAFIEVRDPRLFREFAAPWVAVVGIGAVVLQTLMHNFPVALAAGIGTPLLIGWLASVRVPYGRFLAFTGGASYAMYLWHKDLFLSFGLPGLAIAAGGAAASWLLVERPVLDFAHNVAARLRPVPVPVADAEITVPISPS